MELVSPVPHDDQVDDDGAPPSINIETKGLSQKLKDRLKQFGGTKTLNSQELDILEEELEKDEEEIQLYRYMIILGFTLWLVTIGVIACVVAGIVVGTKDMHSSPDGKMIDNTGAVLQCANSDFLPHSNGELAMRVGKNDPPPTGPLKVGVAKNHFNLSVNASDHDMQNMVFVKLQAMDGLTSFNLNVKSTVKRANGELRITTEHGYVTIANGIQTFTTTEADTAAFMIEEGFFLNDATDSLWVFYLYYETTSDAAAAPQAHHLLEHSEPSLFHGPPSKFDLEAKALAGVTIPPNLNASIVNGWLTVNGVKSYVGTTSSAINAVIGKYFPVSSYTQMTINVKNDVWLNGNNKLNYLTITGDYTADVPIILPHQFILVMDNARLEATPTFPEIPTKWTLINGANVTGNPVPDTNVLSISKTWHAIIVMQAKYFNGVVSPNGPSSAYIGCSKMPPHLKDDPYVGPAGILMYAGGASYIDGITVDNCGQNNGNIVLYGTGRSEVSNCVLKNSRCRGVWVIIMSYTVIHDTEIFGSAKFGIDYDANAGPLSVTYRNNIHDNAYQGVFIEQGATQAIVNDNELYKNSVGVSFYNNLFAQLCADHVVLSNNIHGSTVGGVNIGSLNDQIVGFWPTTDTYVIGNTIYDNYLSQQQNDAKRAGITSNGAIYGVVIMANSDNNGMDPTIVSTMQRGTLIVIDPLKRTTTKSVRDTKKFPNLGATTAINVTITNGVVTEVKGTPISALTVGTVVGSIQTFISTYFGSIFAGDQKMSPYMWDPNVKQLTSFITLTGAYQLSTPLKVPAQTILVLKDASIVAASNFSTDAPGLIIATNAFFSGVVSPGGADTAVINCANVPGPAGIYVSNSSYFTIDGISVANCGGNEGAITIEAPVNNLLGNSTSILNSKIISSTGHGIFFSQVARPIVYKTAITASTGSGIHITDGVFGPILSGNIITNGNSHGVFLGNGSTNAAFRGNMVSGNKGAGFAVTNVGKYQTSLNNVLVMNQIQSNAQNSILLSVDKEAKLVSTVIVGNTIKGNGLGLGAVDPDKDGVQKTMIGSNDDTDGIHLSFISLSNGNGATSAQVGTTSGNYFLDPLNRGRAFAPKTSIGISIQASSTKT